MGVHIFESVSCSCTLIFVSCVLDFAHMYSRVCHVSVCVAYVCACGFVCVFVFRMYVYVV